MPKWWLHAPSCRPPVTGLRRACGRRQEEGRPLRQDLPHERDVGQVRRPSHRRLCVSMEAGPPAVQPRHQRVLGVRDAQVDKVGAVHAGCTWVERPLTRTRRHPLHHSYGGGGDEDCDVNCRHLLPPMEPCTIPAFNTWKAINYAVSFWGAVLLLVAYVLGASALPASTLTCVV